ncbi:MULTISPECIES: ferrous iron transport protein A [Hydrocarboniphaga]|jgi:ferrous iron transport protein A|uniref:Ferrous iron transport protein a n=1 Tax=Hydrocarboniphaga effusa AP103 TaxID=1172194 RepID=I7ZAJ9_9GAMM|nr:MULTISPECIES: FeoA family protein [Hydrocarboniphaga]EIT68889.1 ferrous iron transport protein a [Hydrocarboniphaga effusa AP103]MDZ4080582.1 FeoA family protein [Hydrocarboniphaga sp.]
MRLSELSRGVAATIRSVDDATQPDPIAGRLRELGFVAGEAVRIVARGPFGGDPLLVQIGSTQFALRRVEAARVNIETQAVAT